MKRFLASITLSIVLITCVISPAWAMKGFDPVWVSRGLRLAVYSAPSTASWRGANGKAMCNTDGDVFVAGRDGDWVLIAYFLNHGPNIGGYRVGYVRYSELKGLSARNLAQLPFQYLSGTITSSCYLTDDPLEMEQPITRLSPGTQVTFLMGYENDYGVRFAYIETTYQWQTVRGFVRWDSIQITR